MPTGKTREVLNFRQDDPRENLPHPRHGLQTGERLDSVRLGTARNVECYLTEQFVRVINERNIYRYGLPDTGSGEVVRHSLAIGFVCQLFPERREIGLAIGSVDGREEFGAFVDQRTATA